MSQYIKKYLLSIVATGLLLSVVMSVVPKGSVRRIAVMVGGLLMVLAILSPLVEIDHDHISQAISKYLIETETIQSGIEIESRALLSQVITEKCETYILDKACSMGIQVQVEIFLDDTAKYPYPDFVVIRGSWTPSEKSFLCKSISEELGIPEEQQEWLLM